jgi:NADH-quinone oxidoreductase subunit J
MTNIFFYISAAIAVLSTFMVITRRNGVHALLYLIISFFSLAVVLFLLGAPFIAALEVIIYAGAIMVLFVFVIMMLNLGPDTYHQKKAWLNLKTWAGPAALAAILFGEMIFILSGVGPHVLTPKVIGPKEVGIALFGPYLLSVELASILLLAGLVGAYHLGCRDEESNPRREQR